MRQYERYLLTNLLWPTVLVTASLTGIVWLTQALRFLDFVLNRGLGLGDFLYLTGLLLPSMLLILIPISLTIAVLFSYNKLTLESELVVLSAVGVSRWQLARPALVMGVACTLVCYLLALYLMPLANHKFRDIRSFFRDKYASVLLEEQVFNNPVDGMTVFIRERDDRNNLSGILLHDSRDEKQTITMMADRGRVEQTASGPRFYLQQGVRQTLEKGRVSWLAFDDYAIDIAFYGQDAPRTPDPDEMTLPQLFHPESGTPKQRAAFRAEGHQRLSWPLFCLALPLAALSILFSSEFNRRGQWRRITSAGIGMALLVMVYFGLRNLSMKFAWLTPLIYLAVLGPLAAAFLVLHGRRLIARRPLRMKGAA
ncbi:MAG: LPS export ABC transporter permease LptF [Rickettsiales bacterium]